MFFLFFFEGHTVGEGLPVDEDEVVLVVRVLDGAAVVLVESVVEALGAADEDVEVFEVLGVTDEEVEVLEVLGATDEDVEVLELLRRADDELEEVVEVVLDCEVVVLVGFVEVLIGLDEVLVG